MGGQRGKQWRRMVGSRMVLGAPRTVCCLVGGKAPGDGKKVAISKRRTHQIHLFSLLGKKNKQKTPRNIIGLSRQQKDLAVNWLGAHKTNSGTYSAWLVRAALSARCHVIENVFNYCKTSCFTVAILLPAQRLVKH